MEKMAEMVEIIKGIIRKAEEEKVEEKDYESWAAEFVKKVNKSVTE